MDKVPFLTAQSLITYDLNNIPKDAVKGLARACSFLLGSTNSFLAGFTPSQTLTPSMNINLAEGQILQLSDVDTNPIGSFAADDTQILQQGYAAAQTVALNASGLTSGQAKWWLIEAEFQQVDQVRAGDPTSGARGFYNSANPSDPLDGINGLGGIIPTVRLGFANVTAIAGAPATAGSAVPPSPSSGCVPLFLVEVTFGQTTITTGQIQVAGPAAYSGYQQAPFLAGLVNQHHLGTPGTAPKIDLTEEVQNVLPLPNCPGSSAVARGYFSTMRMAGVNGFTYTGNPNGNLAGTVGDGYYDPISGLEWTCITTGNTTTAVWQTQTVPTVPSWLPTKFTPIAKSASFSATDASCSFYIITATGNITVTLPTSPADGTVYKFIVLSGGGTVTIQTTGGQTLWNGEATGPSMTLKLGAGSPEITAISGGWAVT